MFRVCLEEKLGIFLGFLSLIELVVKQASTSVKYTVEPVNLDGLTLLKVTLFLFFIFYFFFVCWFSKKIGEK